MFNTEKDNNFLNGIHNAQCLITALEQSISKTSEYETRLLKCKSKHPHTHGKASDWSKKPYKKTSKSSLDSSLKPSRNSINLTESWSTVSIVCLQYQYEELTKRYESLLKAYDERNNAIIKRDASLSRLRDVSKNAETEVGETHRALLAVGEKYLALKVKHHSYRHKYNEEIATLKRTLERVIDESNRAHEELNADLTKHLAVEPDACRAALLAEIKKCNGLMVENLKLKNSIYASSTDENRRKLNT